MDSSVSSKSAACTRSSSLRDRIRLLIRDRRLTLLSLVVIVPVGYSSKLYRGPGAEWVNSSLGGLFYDIFWCLVVFLVARQRKPHWIAGLVFVFTCVIEFSQIWHPAWLESLRSHFIGAAILGTTFDWTDFPYYAAGSFLGWLWLCWLASDRDRES